MVISGVLGVIGLTVLFVGIKQIKKMKQDTSEPSTGRPKLMMIVGAIVVVAAVLVMTIGTLLVSGEKKEKQATKESISSSKEQNFLSVDTKTVTLKEGKAKITIELDKDTKLEIKNMNGSVDSIKYEPKTHSQKLNVVFVVAGKYELLATKNKKKIIEKVTVKQDPIFTSSSSETNITTDMDQDVNEQEETIFEEERTTIVPTNEDATVQQSQNEFVPQITEVIPNNNSDESTTGHSTTNKEQNNTPNVNENTPDSSQKPVEDELTNDGDSDKSEEENVENRNDHSAVSSN